MNEVTHRLLNIQWGIFFDPVLRQNQPKALGDEVDANHKHIFNGPVTILPIPEQAPIEIPIMILKSQDGKWQMNISRIRADIIYKPSDINDYEDTEEIREQMLSVMNSCIKQTSLNDVKINRLTNIVNYTLTPKQPVKFLRESFGIKELTNTKELNLRINQNESLEKFDINNITIIETGIDLMTDERIVLLQKDVNTHQAAEKEYGTDEISKFFDICLDLLSWSGIQKIINN